MLSTARAAVLGAVLSAVCACSAGQSASDSRVGVGSPGSAGSTGAIGVPSGSTGGADSRASNINTSSGEPMGDGGDDCGSTLDVTYRDFSEAHPDFEQPFSGDVVRRGLVQPTLGSDHKPVFLDSIGHPATKDTDPIAIDTTWSVSQPVIKSVDSFAQWYNTTADVNIELRKKLKLTETAPGSGIFAFESSAFFPLAPDEGFGITPKNNGQRMNFLFTTEIHVYFTYTAAQKFTFRGDDDLWIFVNGKLALDLGSMHLPEERTIDFDKQAAALGISVGGTYTMDVFHAERHTSGSNFKITTNIACFTPSDVVK